MVVRHTRLQACAISSFVSDVVWALSLSRLLFLLSCLPGGGDAETRLVRKYILTICTAELNADAETRLVGKSVLTVCTAELNAGAQGGDLGR